MAPSLSSYHLPDGDEYEPIEIPPPLRGKAVFLTEQDVDLLELWAEQLAALGTPGTERVFGIVKSWRIA